MSSFNSIKDNISFVSSETKQIVDSEVAVGLGYCRVEHNAHSSDCFCAAAGHIKEAIELLVASNREDAEHVIWELNSLRWRVQRMAKP